MAVLIDTSFLVAVIFPKDANYGKAREARQQIKETRIIAAPVLFELFYMITSRISYSEAIRTFNLIRSAPFQIEGLTENDMARMAEIMEQYRDAELDFADASLMAISERLNITTIYTFDRRDFGMFRPKHTDFLKLLP
jgi:predicted nucleic acid-binding protein